MESKPQIQTTTFLSKSKIPSIGSFLTILEYLESKYMLKYLLYGMNTKGKLFYDSHIESH
jgi:hypothetical protein